MMKLVIDLRLIHNSGIGTYIKNVVPSIIQGFDEVYAIADPDMIKPYSWSRGIKIIPFRSKVYSITEQLMYSIRIPKCDVFWTPHFNAPLLSIKAKRRLVTIHDVNHLANPRYFSFLKRIWARILYANAVRHSDIIYTVSEFSKSEILRFFDVNPDNIKVVYCGVAENFAKKVTQKNNLSLPTNYILFVGNIKPNKNLLALLRAYNELGLDLKKKYKLVILGRKEGFITGDPYIFKFIKEHGLDESIYFTGYVCDNQVPYIYKNATLFIFPSLYEGFGLPILEAMSCSVPVLSSNRASLPEIGGDAPIYFDPENVQELKEKITLLIRDKNLRSELIKKGMKQHKKFSWQNSIDNHRKYVNNSND